MKKTLFSATFCTALAFPALAQSGNTQQGNSTFGQIINVLDGILGDSNRTNNGSQQTPSQGGNTNGRNTPSGTNNGGSIFGNSTLGGILGGATGNSGLNSLSSGDIARGLREALTVGAQNASNRLSAANGFFGDALVKILLPPEAQKVERTLRNIGMGKVVDKAVLSMNRAAEDASKKAVPIFVNAITSMSIQDGLNILQGGRDAATQYLKMKTTLALTNAFRPVISSSLDKVNATALWGRVFNTYNALPTTMTPVNPDLSGYVTERALSGLFLKIADEEGKIRTNPAARVSSILQRVFGAAAGGR